MKYGSRVTEAMVDAFVGLFQPGCRLAVYTESGSLLAESKLGAKPAPKRVGDTVVLPFFEETRAKISGKPHRVVLVAPDGAVLLEGPADGGFVEFDSFSIELNGRLQFGQLVVELPVKGD